MKKFMNLPFEGGLKQVELVNNTEAWEVVEVHYSVSSKRFRAVCFGKDKVIIKERLFNNRVEAEIYIGKQRNESV